MCNIWRYVTGQEIIWGALYICNLLELSISFMTIKADIGFLPFPMAFFEHNTSCLKIPYLYHWLHCHDQKKEVRSSWTWSCSRIITIMFPKSYKSWFVCTLNFSHTFAIWGFSNKLKGNIEIISIFFLDRQFSLLDTLILSSLIIDTSFTFYITNK